MEKVNESTEKIGDLCEKAQAQNNTPQPAIERTQPHQPIENNEGVLYDIELENALKNMKNNTGFFEKEVDQGHGWVWNGYLVGILGGTEVQINDINFNITPGIQKVLVDSSSITIKATNDMD